MSAIKWAENEHKKTKKVNVSIAGPICPNLVIIVPADALAPNGARPSAGTLLTTKLHKFSVKLLLLLMISNNFSGAIQNDRWNLGKSQGISSAHIPSLKSRSNNLRALLIDMWWARGHPHWSRKVLYLPHAFESVVCKMVAILSRPHCVKTIIPGSFL